MQLPTYRGQITRPPPRSGRQAPAITHSDSGRASPVRNGRNQAQTNAEPAEAQTDRHFTGFCYRAAPPAPATKYFTGDPALSDSGVHSSLTETARSSTPRHHRPASRSTREREAVEWPTLSRSDSEQWRPRRGKRRRGTSESCGGSSSCHPTADASTATDSYVLFFSPHCSIHVARGARLRRRSWSAGDAQCLLTSRPLCLCVCDSDPGAAVRVHQLLDLRLRLLQRHPVSAALPFPAPTTAFRTPVLLSAFSVVILSRLLGWECDLQCAFIQTALLVSVQCQSLWRLHSFATLMGIDVAVFKTSEFELF